MRHDPQGARAINRSALINNGELTPTQPQGPFYPIKLPHEIDVDLTRLNNGPVADGMIVYIQGKVMDRTGQVIEDAEIEIWQACESGKYNHPRDTNPAIADANFQYYASTYSDGEGNYIFKTILPGAYPASSDWWRPPHIHFKINVPGFKTLITQLYFDGASFSSDEITRYNQEDLILSRLPLEQQDKLIVEFEDSPLLEDNKLGVFNLYLQRR